MKVFIFILFLSGMSDCAVWGQYPPSRTMQPTAIPSRARPAREVASITFLTAPNGLPVHSLGPDQGEINLGTLSYFQQVDMNGAQIQRQKDSFIVLTRFDLLIDFSNGHRRGTATVSAVLLNANSSGTVWLDGLRLSMTPGVIGRRVSYGVITGHELKIAVPISMPAGPLMDSIGVIVTPN